MTTLTQLASNVATYVNRTDFTTQIELAINRAIQHYARTVRFWFNETTGTFSTVANQLAYGSSDGVPTNILKVDDVTITINSSDTEILDPRTLDWVLDRNVSNIAGVPSDYAYFQNKFYLYPKPDAVYTITLYYLKSYTDLTSAQNNDFTDNAQDLLEMRATWWVYSKLLRNKDAADEAKSAELESLGTLIKQTERLISTGKVRPTDF